MIWSFATEMEVIPKGAGLNTEHRRGVTGAACPRAHHRPMYVRHWSTLVFRSFAFTSKIHNLGDRFSLWNSGKVSSVFTQWFLWIHSKSYQDPLCITNTICLVRTKSYLPLFCLVLLNIACYRGLIFWQKIVFTCRSTENEAEKLGGGWTLSGSLFRKRQNQAFSGWSTLRWDHTAFVIHSTADWVAGGRRAEKKLYNIFFLEPYSRRII